MPGRDDRPVSPARRLLWKIATRIFGPPCIHDLPLAMCRTCRARASR